MNKKETAQEILKWAEKATEGPWFYNSYSAIFSGPMVPIDDEWEGDFDDPEQKRDYYLNADAGIANVPAAYGDTAIGRHQADAEYIAAANPHAIKEILSHYLELLENETDEELALMANGSNNADKKYERAYKAVNEIQKVKDD